MPGSGPKAAGGIAGIYAGPAMLLAGFAAFELGRFNPESYDVAYISLQLATFVLCLITSTHATAMSVRLWSLEAEQQHNFVYNTKWVIPSVARSQCLAQLCYIAGYSRVGWQYFPWSPLRFVPLTAGVLCNVAVLASNTAASAAHRDALRATYAGGDGARSLATRRQYIGLISSRAVFLMGFSWTGVTFFVPSASVRGLNAAYLCTLATAYVCAATAVFASLPWLASMAYLDGAPEHFKLAFAAHARGGSRWLGHLFACALLAMLASLALVGWGLHFPRAAERMVPMYGAAFTLGVVLLVSACLPVAYDPSGSMDGLGEDSLLLQKPRGLAASPSGGGVGEGDGLRIHERLMSQLDAASGEASLAASFCLMPILNFDHAVNAHTDATLRLALLCLLTATFSIGLAVALVVYVVQAAMLARPYALRDHFALSSVVEAVSYGAVRCFQVAVACFMAVFGMVSLTLYAAPTPTTPAIALAGLCAMTVTHHHVQRSYEAARDTRIIPCGEEKKTNEIHFCNLTHRWFEGGQAVYTHGIVTENLQQFSSQAFFFGGFGFFATFFLARSSGAVSRVYVACMGGSFIISLALVTLSTWTQVHMARLSTNDAKEHLAVLLRRPVKLAYYCYLCSTVLFFVGFSLVGYTKLQGGTSAPIIAGGGLAGLVASVASVWSIRRVALIVRLKRSQVSIARPHHDKDACHHYDNMLSRVRAMGVESSFVAGNIFFQVLFTGAGASPSVNALFYGAAACAFSTCCCVAVTGTSIMVQLRGVGPSSDREVFGAEVEGRVSLVAMLYRTAIGLWVSMLGMQSLVQGAPRLLPHFTVATVVAAFAIMSMAWRVTSAFSKAAAIQASHA